MNGPGTDSSADGYSGNSQKHTVLDSDLAWRSRQRHRLSCCLLAAALLCAVTAVFVIKVLPFLEKGFDDGPFYARPYEGSLPSVAPDEEHSYKDGYLQIYNGHTTSPLLVITDAQRRPHLAQLLDVRTNPGHANAEFTSLTIHQIRRGPLRNVADITGRWTFGHERGTIYLHKSGKVQRFYLSW